MSRPRATERMTTAPRCKVRTFYDGMPGELQFSYLTCLSRFRKLSLGPGKLEFAIFGLLWRSGHRVTLLLRCVDLGGFFAKSRWRLATVPTSSRGPSKSIPPKSAGRLLPVASSTKGPSPLADFNSSHQPTFPPATSTPLPGPKSIETFQVALLFCIINFDFSDIKNGAQG